MSFAAAPDAVHLGADALPFVDIDLDADGKVESVLDGPMALEFYLGACEAQGLPRPGVLIE